MASKTSVLAGLDIGTSKITCIAAELIPEGKINIIGVGTAPSKGLRKGVVINIESTVEAISSAISQAETMAGSSIESVYTSISGSHISGFNSHGIVGVKNREVSQDDIERVIEAAKAVAIPMDREVLHVLPQEFIIDDQDGIREPLGISGVRLEARVHIVTGSVSSAQNIVKCANRCGLAVDDIVLASLASAKAVLSPEEMELGVCLIDIGGGTTDILVFQNGAIKHTSVLSVGGNHITNDIAAGLRTPLAAAEKIKCSYGSAVIGSLDKEGTIEVPSTGGREPRVLSKVVLSEIIEPRVTEIFGLIHRELIRSETEGFLTSGLVLTGGCSNLGGMATVAEQTFNLPVRIGTPRGVGGITDIVSTPESASGVGLILYATSQGTEKRHNRKGKISLICRRVANWIHDNF